MKILLYAVVVALLFSSCKSQFPIINTEKAKNPQYESYVKTKAGHTYAGPSIEKKNESKLFKPTLFVIEIQLLKKVTWLNIKIKAATTKDWQVNWPGRLPDQIF